MNKSILVTGGCGFIGSNFVEMRLNSGDFVINYDKLTYAANLDASLSKRGRHRFVCGDISDSNQVGMLLNEYMPDAIVHFAAETHVDRSILNPEFFLKTNVLGTEVLLRTVKEWWIQMPENKKKAFRFLHISTDEVFGSLPKDGVAFTECSRFSPNSPYAASKAASDHFVRAYHETYGLPTLITNCSNNYGPRQFPEKLIPLMILNAIDRKPLPIYGNGENIRDWLHVEDHCDAIYEVLSRGRVGETYNIGGRSEKTNNEIVNQICEILDEVRPRCDNRSYKEQIMYVRDRLGHDFRYAVDCSKIEQELGWRPKYSFTEGLRETVLWYLNNPKWVQNVKSGAYRSWVKRNYGE